jgi:hypothetical protein
MQKAGGIISIIAGVFGTIAAGATLMFGGLGAAFDATGADTVIGLGWGGVLFSFLVIISGSLLISAKNTIPAIATVVFSGLGVFLGGGLVAIFMALSVLGGILGFFGIKQAESQSVNQTE